MTVVAPDPAADVSIRAAVRADLLAIYRIEKASFPQPWPYSAFEGYLDGTVFLVAEDADDGVVGYVVASAVPNHGRALGHVKDLAVHPDRRGEGIGRRLLSAAISGLAARNVGRVKLEVRRSNERARSLYRRFGFEHRRTLPRYYEDGEDAFLMVADLDDRGE
ncbi:ribosomal-protein-alanine N-acetyltransferase [Halobacteriales archaeon QS_1_68_17]|nr:MAG: ribosomal-protein-alanine N-acetyltransferase [Halobacteriales archaeon QS_1_68_17]